MKSVQDRPGLLLPNGLPLLGVQLFDVPLDLIDPGELLQGELGDLALVGRVQVEELAPGMGQTAHLGHAAGDQGLVAAEVVAGQAALSGLVGAVPQEAPGVFARAGFAEVVDHSLDALEGPRRIGPEVGAVRLAIAGLEHGHRRLIGV